jgi:oxygen-dependent protoporphyrinogen oxidase
VATAYRASDLPPSIRGFGFLAPRGEGLRVLGSLFSSRIFPGRAPTDRALLQTMVGGATDPEAHRLEDVALLGLVRDDLARATGLRAEPLLARVVRHPRGIPQYVLGHLGRLARIESRLGSLPGLFLCGNSYRGISINDCVAEAPRVAAAVLAHRRTWER